MEIHAGAERIAQLGGCRAQAIIRQRRYLRRAVFIVDRTGKLSYVAYMQHNGLEPNYDEVIEAAKAAL